MAAIVGKMTPGYSNPVITHTPAGHNIESPTLKAGPNSVEVSTQLVVKGRICFEDSTPATPAAAPAYVLEKDRPLTCMCGHPAAELPTEIRCKCGMRLRGDRRNWRLYIRQQALRKYYDAQTKWMALHVAPPASAMTAGHALIGRHILAPEREAVTKDLEHLCKVLYSTVLDEEMALEALGADADAARR